MTLSPASHRLDTQPFDSAPMLRWTRIWRSCRHFSRLLRGRREQNFAKTEAHMKIASRWPVCFLPTNMVRQRSLSSEVAARLLEVGDEMSDYVRDSTRTIGQGGTDQSFAYPWAAAPDIIRSHQKDAYFQSILLGRLEAVIRSLYGARTAHTWTTEARTFTELLYLGLTTFVGNRTLGEEYTDIVQVEDNTHRLPSIFRRSGYITSSVLLPYVLSRFLPAFRTRLRAKLEKSLMSSTLR